MISVDQFRFKYLEDDKVNSKFSFLSFIKEKLFHGSASELSPHMTIKRKKQF